MLLAPVLALAALGGLSGAGAQQLTLKRTLPDEDPGGCPAAPAPARTPTDEEAEEAAQLASAATQSAILGDQAQARDLLERAARLDPTSVSVAYQLGRTLEELGERRGAVAAYCRYLELAPGGPDADDVEGRIDELASRGREPVPDQAALAFERGVRAFDRQAFGDAARAFSGALTSAPRLAEAYYNRAMAYAAEGRYALAVEDLRRYLELSPDSPDREVVQERIGLLRNPPARYSAPTALLGGLVLPGFGQFYTGRPLAGFGFLAVAAGAATFGLMYETVDIQCRQPPVDGMCPPSEVLSRDVDRPFLVPGLGVAAATAVVGAVNAFLGARSSNQEAAGVLRLGGGPEGGGILLAVPSVGPSEGGLAVEVRLRF